MQERSHGARLGAPTLREVWRDYQMTRTLKPVTVRNYDYRLTVCLGDWLDRPVTEISKDEIELRHRHIKGKAMANSTMRTLRALLRYAEYKYQDREGNPILRNNPVRRLSEVRAWHKDRRRTRLILPAQLGAWFRAVFSLDSQTMRDYLLVLLLTGLRRSEAINLRWDDVDLGTGILTIHDTKNGDDLSIPVSDYAWNLLAMRKFAAQSEWVFPGPSQVKPITAAHRSYKIVSQRSGVVFSPHDLRRTFVTVADDLDLKSEVIKALVNHRSSDVTEGYTIRSIERLRRATQRITDAILIYGGLRRPRA